jgi:hypothetical protein
MGLFVNMYDIGFLAGKEGEKRRDDCVHSDPSRIRSIEWERYPLYERADQVAPHTRTVSLARQVGISVNARARRDVP